MPDHRVYREGRVHVVQERCSSCVFRPGNLMHLEAGKLADLVADNLANEAALQCHQTLEYSPQQKPGAVCRGFYDGYAQQSKPLALAGIIGVLEFDS